MGGFGPRAPASAGRSAILRSSSPIPLPEERAMTFVQTIAEQDAEGDVAAMYDTDRAATGQLLNYARAFSPRPDVYAAWKALNAAVKGHMDPRRFELATIAAARQLRSSYCALAHGSVL